MLLAGVKPGKCILAGVEPSDMRKILKFRAVQGQNLTLSEFAVKTGLSRHTCNNLKKIYLEHKRRRA